MLRIYAFKERKKKEIACIHVIALQTQYHSAPVGARMRVTPAG